MTTPGPSRVRANDAKVHALVNEFMEEQRRQEPPTRRGRDPKVMRQRITVALALVCACAWLAPFPAAASFVPVDPKLERASARMSVFLAAQRVVFFRTAHARLPRTASEAGVSGSDIIYLPGHDGSFVLLTQVGHHTFSYDSTMPLRSILGNSEAIIERAGH